MNQNQTTADQTATPTALVTLVTAEACHFCDDAHRRLDDLAKVGLLELATVPADSAAGQSFIEEHRPRMFPLMLVDGKYYNDGRLSRGKLARLVESFGAP